MLNPRRPNKFPKHKKKKKKQVAPTKLPWIKRQAKISRVRKPKNENFEIDWPRVEVSDKTLLQLAKHMNCSEEEAFDRALDILEQHENFRIDNRMIYRERLKEKFRGEWIHLQWHTYENVQIGIENNRWTRVNFSDEVVYVPDHLAQQIYNAEDGRCEECGQAMHFRTAHFGKRDPGIFGDLDNIKLLCYACRHGRSNALLHPDLLILDRNMDYLRERMGFSNIEELKTFLKDNLKYAVHTNTFNPNKQANRKQVKAGIRGQYWLPGIGRARLKYKFIDNKKRLVLEFVECAANPKLKIQPQKRSRNILI